MIERVAITVLLAVTMYAGYSFPERVTRRCKGEASFALSGCACTVRNRLVRGWTEATVLRPFYAPDVVATADEITLVNDVLTGATACDDRYYFMFGYGDIVYLHLQNTPPIAKVVSGKQSIWYYEYHYALRKK